MQGAPGGKALHVALAQNKQDRQRKARQASRARVMNGDASSDRVSLIECSRLDVHNKSTMLRFQTSGDHAGCRLQLLPGSDCDRTGPACPMQVCALTSSGSPLGC